MRRKCCDRCSAITLGPVSVVEISRLAHREPEPERILLCSECADSIRAYLLARPEVLNPPFTTISR
jgi:hypothetical protein